MRKAKNRIHSVILNEKAELVYRDICSKRGTKWFHRFISEYIIDHGSNRAILVKELNDLQKQRDHIENKMISISEEMKNAEGDDETQM